MERVCKKLDISFEFACGGFFEADIPFHLFIFDLLALYLRPLFFGKYTKLLISQQEGVE